MPILRSLIAAIACCALLGAWLPARSAPPAEARTDLLTATLAGEYALQAGRLDEAARWYLDAAIASVDDAGLAERATRIALLADEDARATTALALWSARAPRSLAMRAAEATLSLRRGDAAAARSQLDALLRDADDDGWRHALVALGGGKEPALSARVLGELVDGGAIPAQLPSWLAFGGLAQRLDPALAERIVQQVVARFPGEPRVALLRAGQLREAGEPVQAAAVLEALGDPARLSAELRLSLAGEWDALGEPSRAEAVLAQGEQDDQLYALRASLLARAEDKPALERLYDRLRVDSTDPDPRRRLLLGQTAEYLERYPDALQWYRTVPGGNQRWQARLRSTSVLYKLGQSRQAFADLRALQADAAIDEEARRDAYLFEAELRLEDDDARGEYDAYARGLAAYPDDGVLLYARALMWERRDDIARAEADLRKVLAAEPDNVGALNALGYTLADRTTRYQEALELIDRARAAEPGSAAIVDSYGWVLYRLGRHEEAVQQLRRAYMLQKDAEIAAHLGEVLWVMGDRKQARRYFEEARKLDPDSRALQRALRETGA